MSLTKKHTLHFIEFVQLENVFFVNRNVADKNFKVKKSQWRSTIFLNNN